MWEYQEKGVCAAMSSRKGAILDNGPLLSQGSVLWLVFIGRESPS